jgi:hypothetical protein
MGLIEELSGKLENQVIDDMPEELISQQYDPDVDSEELDMFQAFKDSGTAFRVAFANSTPEGDFFINAAEDGSSRLTIIMKAEDASRWEGRSFDVSKRGNTLGKMILVKIKEIDREKGLIYVEAEKYAENLQRDAINDELNAILTAANRANASMCTEVNATVIGVYQYHVVLNIANSGAIARVSIRNWSKLYVFDLNSMCRKGDVYKINIIGRAHLRREYDTPTWEAEHISFTIDPWKLIDTNKIKQGVLLTVRCVRTDYRVNRWWAVPVDNSVLPAGMELFGGMKSGEDAVRPQVDGIYQAMIVNVNLDKRSLKILPYRPILEERNAFGVRAGRA